MRTRRWGGRGGTNHNKHLVSDPDQYAKVIISAPSLHENEEGFKRCPFCGCWVKPRKDNTFPNHATDGRNFRATSNTQTWCKGSDTVVPRERRREPEAS
jgi:hypothetical protein